MRLTAHGDGGAIQQTSCRGDSPATGQEEVSRGCSSHWILVLALAMFPRAASSD